MAAEIPLLRGTGLKQSQDRGAIPPRRAEIPLLRGTGLKLFEKREDDPETFRLKSLCYEGLD